MSFQGYQLDVCDVEGSLDVSAVEKAPTSWTHSKVYVVGAAIVLLSLCSFGLIQDHLSAHKNNTERLMNLGSKFKTVTPEQLLIAAKEAETRRITGLARSYLPALNYEDPCDTARIDCCTDPSYPVLGGLDVVKLQVTGELVFGNPKYTAEVSGITRTYSFWFSEKSSINLFEANPDAFLPKWGGFDVSDFCTVGGTLEKLVGYTVDLSEPQEVDGHIAFGRIPVDNIMECENVFSSLYGLPINGVFNTRCVSMSNFEQPIYGLFPQMPLAGYPVKMSKIYGMSPRFPLARTDSQTKESTLSAVKQEIINVEDQLTSADLKLLSTPLSLQELPVPAVEYTYPTLPAPALEYAYPTMMSTSLRSSNENDFLPAEETYLLGTAVEYTNPAQINTYPMQTNSGLKTPNQDTNEMVEVLAPEESFLQSSSNVNELPNESAVGYSFPRQFLTDTRTTYEDDFDKVDFLPAAESLLSSPPMLGTAVKFSYPTASSTEVRALNEDKPIVEFFSAAESFKSPNKQAETVVETRNENAYPENAYPLQESSYQNEWSHSTVLIPPPLLAGSRDLNKQLKVDSSGNVQAPGTKLHTSEKPLGEKALLKRGIETVDEASPGLRKQMEKEIGQDVSLIVVGGKAANENDGAVVNIFPESFRDKQPQFQIPSKIALPLTETLDQKEKQSEKRSQFQIPSSVIALPLGEMLEQKERESIVSETSWDANQLLTEFEQAEQDDGHISGKPLGEKALLKKGVVPLDELSPGIRKQMNQGENVLLPSESDKVVATNGYDFVPIISPPKPPTSLHEEFQISNSLPEDSSRNWHTSEKPLGEKALLKRGIQTVDDLSPGLLKQIAQGETLKGLDSTK